MVRRIIDTGALGNDGTGDSIRDSFRKVNENFRELYSSLGLGDRLTFIGLDDTPAEYDGQANLLLGVKDDESGVEFKSITGGPGIQVDLDTNPREVRISAEFTGIVNDNDPRLGGDLKARSGAEQYRIIDLPPYNFSETNTLAIGGPVFPNEAASKAYADSKISRAGIDAIDPGNPDLGPIREFGQMTGPLVLSRNPEPEDDEKFGGLIAATKRYVDTGGFSSKVNLYVATSGEDERPGIAKDVQGRSLASAFKTFEAALKRAEELVLESPLDIGPYKKVLTYQNGTKNATLAGIVTSPDSGSGFAGFPEMRVDEIRINLPGNNYRINDIVEIIGGNGSAARIQVLDTITTPGGIRRFRIVSSGLYNTTLPTIGINGITSQLIGDTSSGAGATFNVTYRVNNIVITDNGGSLSPNSPPTPVNPGDPLPFVDYGLVSVRIVGGGGSGAFGTADVVNGQINSITVNDAGKGFVSIPSVVADLPRFLLRTEGFRTDATGDVTTDTAVAFRSRDLREGLFIKGQSSGALAIILAHEGELDSDGNEIFDMDIVLGSFEPNEVLSYGDSTKFIQISVLVESGTYEENLPLKVPQNVAIIGDEFRRVILRPKQGISSSPWVFQKFRRDTELDGLQIATQLYGHHYLTDSTQSVYPKINNKGDYVSSATLIDLNRFFLQDEVIAFIDYLINQNISPFSISFDYDRPLLKKNVGLLIDSIIFDLKYGEYNRTISSALKYFQSTEGLNFISAGIGGQLTQTVTTFDHLRTLIKTVVSNTLVDPSYNETTVQIIDSAFSAELASLSVIDELFDAFVDIISTTEDFNSPKNNNEIDVFLCNDAIILRAITCQGAGGFTMVLDPEGQILAKSPYAQECASFSRSINAQTFAGGMFVDGFTGNLQFLHTGTIDPFRIEVSGLSRRPETPCSFIVQDTVFRVNFIRDFIYNPNGSSCNLNLDETTPFFRSPGGQEFTITPGNPATLTRLSHGLENGSTLKFTSTISLPIELVEDKEYYVIADGLSANNFRISENPAGTVGIEISGAGSGTLSYVRIYELLMPGNRSMLSNDFTQICDLGYGLIATNGGLTESVSMFTYYCHISYYSLNGGQIRSIGGSSAHGNFALVAEGSDPLEIPTPVSTYNELAQKLICVTTQGLQNAQGDLFVHVTGYEYVPVEDSELEVDHNGIIFRYPIISVGTEELPPGVARLNLATDGSEGLFDAIPDGEVLTWRVSSKIVLTGDIVEVAVRPSTGLKLNETPNTVYRVIQFNAYDDPSGPYPISYNALLNGLEVLTTIISIGFGRDGITPAPNVCTTDGVHRLQRGDQFVPKSNSNGLIAGNTYFVIESVNANQFLLSSTLDGVAETLSDGTNLLITGAKSHRLLEDYLLEFFTDGVLPTGLTQGQRYFIVDSGLTDTLFRVSVVKNGDPTDITDAGTGNHVYAPKGLALTQLRENYDYIDITLFQPGEFATNGTVCTISVGTPGVITSVAHGLIENDVIKFTTTGNLPTGLSSLRNYLVHSTPTPDTFTVKIAVGGGGVNTVIAGNGVHRYGLVTGRAGDLQFAVVGVSPDEAARIPNSKFMFKGQQYVVTDYNTETGEPYARLTLDRPLVNSIIALDGIYSIKSAVPSRSSGASGTLTIRISLTRVTSHDLLEIGTGSYADTNYPQEIYGPPVNPPDESKETDERTVGRVFYVTTDQFGNFRVGPFFSVDQGTGRVTFSAAIALSNLDGIGFKRGVPISEFSIDSGFSDNAIDTVPTENAARTYIERRLGVTHGGAATPIGQLIPPVIGGFMALSGLLPMKENMNLGNNKIVTMDDPTELQDAVNLRSLTFSNFQETTISNLQANDILAFTGVDQNAINAEMIGDIQLTVNVGNNTINAQINPESIIDADVNSAAGIVQSKLVLNSATTRNNATGIAQSDLGVASFNSSEFETTNGWINIRTNGIDAARIQKIPSQTVLANNLLTTDNVTAVGYSSVVDLGLAIKKSQFGINPVGGVTNGFVRRNTAGTSDASFQTVDMSVGFIGYSSADNSRLVQRDATGNFGGNKINVNELQLNATRALDFSLTATGGVFRLRGFSGRGGILVQDGTLPTDPKTGYWNNQHEFKDVDGFDFAPIRCSTIEATALVHPNGNTGSGSITGRWTLTGTSPNESRLQATYSADLAEYYEGDAEYKVGTVLIFGGDKEVTVSTTADDTAVAGVVSDTAAFAMFEGCPGLKNLVALQGRVPCQVVGKIKKGDLLITSNIPGVATVAGENTRVGTIVGKAIENYDSDKVGVVEIAVGRT